MYQRYGIRIFVSLLAVTFLAGASFAQKLTEQHTTLKTEETSDSEPREEELTRFAENVTLHVVLHELAHALIREFDLPILGNEETMADAFATHYLTFHMPDRAEAVIRARVQSLMFEAGEVPKKDWEVQGEHNNDARRAYQIVALAIAADPKKYKSLGDLVEMSERQIGQSSDYGAEIHRSWRRILKPIWMTKGMQSNEARIVFDEGSVLARAIRSGSLAGEIQQTIKRFDWHSQIKVTFVQGEGGAGWSRSKRTIAVHDEYIDRFVRQGREIEKGNEKK